MTCPGRKAPDRKELDALYDKYNRREYVHPDPLEFLYRYEDARDRETAGLVASGLAYGRVRQIIRSVESVLEKMPAPAEFVRRSTEKGLRRAFGGFKHRFTTGDDLAAMLTGVKRAMERYGSLEGCFAAGMSESDESIMPGVRRFAAQLNIECGRDGTSLVPKSQGASACKRLNLFLRWMVRRDEVDPGCWESVGSEKLVVPLDTHMHRICRIMGMTGRKQADAKTALEITEAFKAICPGDPVKYDFALTRAGMRGDEEAGRLLARCGVGEGG